MRTTSAHRFAAVSTLVFALALAGALASPAIAPAAAAPALALRVPAAVRANRALPVRGTASGIAAGDPIVVYVQVRGANGSWQPVSTSALGLDANGAFAIVTSLPARGHYRVYADAPATPTHALVRSNVAPVKAVGKLVVALTFDDGPWRGSTDKIVRTLAANDADATFFMLGGQAKGQRARVAAVSANGNAVAVHSWKHAMMGSRSPKVNAADLKRCIQVLTAETGVRPRWFRPPGGDTSPALKRTAAKLGLRTALWTADTRDYTKPGVGTIASRAIKGAKHGGIVLMHDGGGDRSQTVKALPVIIRKLKARGYDFVTLDELAALGYRIR